MLLMIIHTIFSYSEYFASSGLDYSTRSVVVDGDKVQVQVWDMSGEGMSVIKPN